MRVKALGATRIEPAQLDRAKTHPPVPIGDLLDANTLAGQRVADVHPASAPADLPIGQGAAHHGRGRIGEFRQALRERAGRGLMDGRRRVLAQGLVRPLGIVDRPKPIEGALLRPARALRRLGRLFFQGAVHPLMLRVLLGMARGNALGANPQADPPYGQAGQAARAHGGEGRPVVSPDRRRQAILPEGGPNSGRTSGSATPATTWHRSR